MARISFDGYSPTLLTKDIIDGVESVIHPAGAHPSHGRGLDETGEIVGRVFRNAAARGTALAKNG
jgi:hypothetical protein